MLVHTLVSDPPARIMSNAIVQSTKNLYETSPKSEPTENWKKVRMEIPDKNGVLEVVEFDEKDMPINDSQAMWDIVIRQVPMTGMYMNNTKAFPLPLCLSHWYPTSKFASFLLLNAEKHRKSVFADEIKSVLDDRIVKALARSYGASTFSSTLPVYATTDKINTDLVHNLEWRRQVSEHGALLFTSDIPAVCFDVITPWLAEPQRVPTHQVPVGLWTRFMGDPLGDCPADRRALIEEVNADLNELFIDESPLITFPILAPKTTNGTYFSVRVKTSAQAKEYASPMVAYSHEQLEWYAKQVVILNLLMAKTIQVFLNLQKPGNKINVVGPNHADMATLMIPPAFPDFTLFNVTQECKHLLVDNEVLYAKNALMRIPRATLVFSMDDMVNMRIKVIPVVEMNSFGLYLERAVPSRIARINMKDVFKY